MTSTFKHISVLLDGTLFRTCPSQRWRNTVYTECKRDPIILAVRQQEDKTDNEIRKII